MDEKGQMMDKPLESENMDTTLPPESQGATRNMSLSARVMALSKVYPHPEMVIVAANTGTGVLSADLAPLVKQVYWLGRSAAMLAAARRQLSGLDNIDFQILEGLDLPLADSSVDGIIADLDLSTTPNPQAVIREYARILRPGGRLVLTLIDAGTFAPPEFEEAAADFDAQNIRTWLQAAGLVNVIVDCGDQAGLFDSSGAADARRTERFFIAVGTRRVTARQLVEDSYGARAQEANSCCGDDSCCIPGVVSLNDLDIVHWEAAYSPAELADIPHEAAEFSLGCGNPLAMASLRPGETVLDIGSGGGIDVFLAARQVGEDGFVFGVDMTAAMLERARKTAQQNGITNVEFRAGYAEALPVEAESVDVVISNCVINLSEDKGQVFREAYRVTKPGGRLEVNDTVFGAGVLPALQTSASGWAECISGALPEGEYLDLVRQAGFRDIRVQRSTSSGTSAGVPFYSIQVSAKK